MSNIKTKISKYFIITLMYWIILYLVAMISSCNYSGNSAQESKQIRSLEEPVFKVKQIEEDTVKKLTVALAAIISPKETFRYYEELLRYVSQKMGYKVEFKQRKTYQEVNSLIEKKEVDLAFICSGAYVEGKEKKMLELLAVPVCNGKPNYNAYVIVHKNSDIQKFADLKGKSFAYTDPMSNSGKLYADKRLHELGYTEKSFFSKTFYSYAHDVSIQLVAKKLVDGATVDGLIFDYIKYFYPERVKNVTVIEISEPFGIPPVVVPSNFDPVVKKKLSEILVTMHTDSTGRKILDKLLIERFIIGNDEDYNSIRTIIYNRDGR